MRKTRRIAVLAMTTLLATFGALVTAAPAQAASCGVSGGLLWCGNVGGAEIRSKPSTDLPPSTVVDHLRTTYSWFDCWSEGQIHPGGNYTWYHTQGDDNGKYGWVAAAYVYTSSTFDSNPSSHGLRKCQYNFG